LADAQPLLRGGLEAHRRVSGSQHIETAFALDNLAALLTETGNLDESEALLREALPIFEANLRPDAPPLRRTTTSLADILTKQGKLDEAEPLARTAAAELARVKGKGTLSTQRARETLAQLLIARNDFAAAEAMLLESHHDVAESKPAGTRAERAAMKQLLALYEAWEAAEPGKDAQGKNLWRNKLEALGPQTQP